MDMSRLEIRVRLAAEDVASHLMVHREEIEAEVKKGVAEAMARTELATIARDAAERAMKDAIGNAVRNFFLYSGEGTKAVNAAIQSAAEKAIKNITENL